MDEEKYKKIKRGEQGALLSIAAYLFLAAIKWFIGYLTGSEALEADGLNNATDIVVSLAILIGLKFSRKPPDHNHAYGHWKSESIASLIASLIIMAAGGQVLIEAVSTLMKGRNEAPDLLAAYVALASAAVMFGVYRYNKKLAAKIDSHSLVAAAKDNLSDCLVSIGTAIGIVASQFNLPWVDPLAALIIGLLILRTGWEIFKEGVHLLTDGFEEEILEDYKRTVNQLAEVKGVKSIKARHYGNNVVVDIIILVQATLTVSEAHEIATKVEKTLKKKHGVYDVHVHVEPAEGERG